MGIVYAKFEAGTEWSYPLPSYTNVCDRPLSSSTVKFAETWAGGLGAGEPEPEKTEHLSVQEVSYRRLQAMIRCGEFRDGMGLAALHLAAPSLENKLAHGAAGGDVVRKAV